MKLRDHAVPAPKRRPMAYAVAYALYGDPLDGQYFFAHRFARR